MKKITKIFCILAFTLFLSSFTFSATLIEGGGFEAGDPPDFWTNAVCSHNVFVFSPPISSSIDWGTSQSFTVSTDGVSEGTKSAKCLASSQSGTSGSDDLVTACIVNSTNKDCVSASNMISGITDHGTATIILTEDYSSDFNILLSFDNAGNDFNFFSMEYGGSTELSSGETVKFELTTCNFGGTGCGDGFAKYVTIDNVRKVGHTLTETIPIQPMPSNTNFTMRAIVTDTNGSNIEVATVRITVNGETDTMVFSNGQYRFTYDGGLPRGVYDYNIGSSFEGEDQNVFGQLSVVTQEFQYLTFTPIKNILSYSFGSIDIAISSTEIDDFIIWRVDSNSVVTETPTYKWFNFVNTGRQYSVYTSTDGESWVFDATLTYGSDNENPVQKIWNEDLDRFDYSFTDTLSPLETKYYKLEFQLPSKHWAVIGNSEEWTVFNPPIIITDVNTIHFEEYSISQYSGIRNVLKQYVPDVNSGDETSAYELQFTAKADVNGTGIEVGQTINNVDSGKSAVELTTTWHRYSFTIDATDFDSQLLIINSPSTSANIQITDYALITRAFFTKRLKILQDNGDELPLFFLNNFSNKYLQEGNPFKITTGAYDRSGVLDELRLEAYFETVSANNLVKKSIFSIYKTDVERVVKMENAHDFESAFPPIIDLNGTAHNPAIPRNLILKANIFDVNGVNVAVQSERVKFLQYPYFPNDIKINFFPTEKRKGKKPTGILELEISRPETLLGFDLRIYSDSNTVNAPNYMTQIFKETDFECTETICSLQISVDEYLFEDVNLTTITWFALLNTEYLNFDNNLTRVDRRIFVTPIEFETAKIHQVIERADRTYRESEEIPVVLILRDSEADNLKNKIEPYITIQNCNHVDGNAGNCVDQTIQYKPTGFVYDDKFNYNYFFFRHLYVLDNGNLLPDGNYISFRATVTDKTGVRTTITPVMTDKCKNQSISIGNFFKGSLSFLIEFSKLLAPAITGCQDAQFSKVTITENFAQERRLLIDEDHTISNPAQVLFACVSPDSNNVYGDPLKQDLLCFTWYEVGESPIDNFRMRITNKYSDLSIEGTDRQYIEFNIPYEIIANNDVQLLRKELETNQNTTIDTVGEFFYEGLRMQAGSLFAVYGLINAQNLLQSNNLITNIGADYNFNQAFSSTTVEGAMFYKIKGIPVINAGDYSRTFKLKDIYENINRKSFLKVLRQNEIDVRKTKPVLELTISNFTAPVKFTDEKGALLIDEQPLQQLINTSNLDENSTQQYVIAPNIINLSIQNTMFWNNFSQNETRSISMQIKFIVKDTFGVAIGDFIEDAINDPVGTITTFLSTNLLLIMAILILLSIGGVVYALWFRS